MVNFFDILVLINAVGLAASGFFEGLVRGLVRLAGLVVTLVIMSMYAAPIREAASAVSAVPEKVMTPLLFVLVFVCGVLVFHFLAAFLHTIIHKTPIGFIDSGFGATFGLLKALVINGVLATLLAFAPPASFFGRQYGGSVFAPSLAEFLAETIPVVRGAAVELLEHLDAPDPETETETVPRPDMHDDFI